VIDQAYQNFVSNIERAYKISEINDQIIDIALTVLKGVVNDLSDLHKRRIEEKITLLENVQDSGVAKDILPIVYGQQIVLMVSAAEMYINELIKIVGDQRRQIIKWPQSKFNKQIDIDLLQDSAVTIGDLVLGIVQQNGNNFQDLQSIKRFFEDYLNICLELDDIYENNYIQATAMRHSFTHNGGIIDKKFITQVRNLPDADNFQEGSPINLTSEHITEFRDSFLAIGERIKVKLEEKIHENL
jgi:hypothetical protein